LTFQFPYPEVDASLNAASAVLIIAGVFFIRRRRVCIHKACMLSASFTSLLFLVSYVTYHIRVGSVHFMGQGAIRRIYFALLFSHTALAVVIVPLVLRTLTLGLRGQFETHRRLARWTAPLWMYVSVTGVVIYWMLYRGPWKA
jgi:putative membrane protein